MPSFSIYSSHMRKLNEGGISVHHYNILWVTLSLIGKIIYILSDIYIWGKLTSEGRDAQWMLKGLLEDKEDRKNISLPSFRRKTSWFYWPPREKNGQRSERCSDIGKGCIFYFIKIDNVRCLWFYSVKPSCMDDKHVGHMFIQVLSHGQLCHKIIQ